MANVHIKTFDCERSRSHRHGRCAHCRHLSCTGRSENPPGNRFGPSTIAHVIGLATGVVLTRDDPGSEELETIDDSVCPDADREPCRPCRRIFSLREQRISSGGMSLRKCWVQEPGPGIEPFWLAPGDRSTIRYRNRLRKGSDGRAAREHRCHILREI
jgi:hypothetical protein